MRPPSRKNQESLEVYVRPSEQLDTIALQTLGNSMPVAAWVEVKSLPASRKVVSTRGLLRAMAVRSEATW